MAAITRTLNAEKTSSPFGVVVKLDVSQRLDRVAFFPPQSPFLVDRLDLIIEALDLGNPSNDTAKTEHLRDSENLAGRHVHLGVGQDPPGQIGRVLP